MMKAEHTEVSIENLVPYEKNTRRHSVKQVEEIRRSLRAFGQFRNIVVDDTNTILCGHGVVEAMKAEGLKTARAYIVSDVTEKQKAKLLLADNRTQDLGKDDFDAVEDLIRFIGETDIPGYDEEAINMLLMESDNTLEAAKQEVVESEYAAQFGGSTDGEGESFLSAGSTEPTAPPDEKSMEEITGHKPGTKVRVEYNKKIVCPHCAGEIWF